MNDLIHAIGRTGFGFVLGFFVAVVLGLLLVEWAKEDDKKARSAIEKHGKEIEAELSPEMRTIRSDYVAAQVSVVTHLYHNAFAEGLRAAGVRAVSERVESLVDDPVANRWISIYSQRLGSSHAMAFTHGVSRLRLALGKTTGLDDRALDAAMDAAFNQLARELRSDQN